MTYPDLRIGAQRLLDRLQARSEVPLGVHLQIADRCNHACAHCYQVQGHKGEMSTEQIFGVLDRLARAGVLLLNVSGGEPTLRADLIPILRHALRAGFAVRLLSNGYAIDDRLGAELAGLHLLGVNVSVYSHLGREHDAVTGVPGSWERTTGAIQCLAEHGANVVMKWPATSRCSSTFAQMRALACALGATFDRAASMIVAREDGCVNTTHGMMKDDADQAALASDPDRTDIEVEPAAEKLDQHPCGACRTALVVLPNGAVSPCPGIALVLGDAACDELSTIVRTKPYAFLRGVRWRDVHGCRDCDLLPYCYRCHADALRHAGDLLGPYEPACRVARAHFQAGTGREAAVTVAGDRNTGCRSADVGPYRVDGERGWLLPIDDVVTSRDRDARRRFPWILSAC